MGEVLELLNSVVGHDESSPISNYLQSLSELRCFYNNKESIQNTVSLVNKLLNEVETREKGLQLLQVFLPQCDLPVLSANIVSWMSQCLKGVSQKQNNNPSSTSLQVLCSLLEATSELNEVRPQVTSNIIPKFFDIALSMLDSQPKKSTHLLACLEKCFILYGKASVSVKGMIHLKLIKLLDSSSDVVKSASKCYTQLSLLGAPGPNMQNYKSAWQNQQLALIDAMHSILNILFDNVNEIQISYNRSSEAKSVEEIKVTKLFEKSPIQKAQILTNRFNGLATFLISMLRLSFPTVKVVDTNAILSVVCRTLAVTCSTLQAHTTVENIILTTQIPSLHISCLQLLEAMIQCSHMRALKHTTVICKLLTQSLKWTTVEDRFYAQDKPYSSIREQAYNCLTCWLLIARSGSNIENYVDDIKLGLVSDICSNKPAVTLTLNNNTKGKGKIGKRKQNKLSKNEKEKPTCLVNVEANKSICCAALKALTFIFEASSTLLKPKFHTEMQEMVVKLLMQLQLCHTTKIPIPYKEENCRLALYTALLAINNNFHSQCPPPYQLSSIVFYRGLTDPSLKVIQFCTMALGNLNNILCPITPGVVLPSDVNEKFKDDEVNETSRFYKSSSKAKPSGINNRQEDVATSYVSDRNIAENVNEDDGIMPDMAVSSLVVKESNSVVTDTLEIEKISIQEQVNQPVNTSAAVPAVSRTEGTLNNSSQEPKIPSESELDTSDQMDLNLSDEAFFSQTNSINGEDVVAQPTCSANDDEIPRKKMKLTELGEEPAKTGDLEEEEEEMMLSFVDEVNV